MSSATYRTLLRADGAAAFFLTAAVGRVGIAMTSLGIVWLVHARTGSYATAGLVTGGFAVAEAAAGPQLARLIDRFGQTRVLVPALLAHAAAVATLLALAAAGTPDWLMTGGGILAGATIPQLGALSSARWVALLAAPQTLLVSWLTEDGQIEAITSADWQAWGVIAYQAAFVTVMGYGVWYRMMRRFPVNQVMPFTLLSGLAVPLSNMPPIFQYLTLADPLRSADGAVGRPVDYIGFGM